MSARLRLGLRAEKRASGAGLTIAAFAVVGRTPCADQGQLPGWPLPQWRIPANADGTASGPFFELTLRAGRIAPPARHAFGARPARQSRRVALLSARAQAWQVLGAMRAGRCVSSEKWPAGVPIGGGPAFVSSVHSTWLSNRSLTGAQITRAGAAIVRPAPKGHFSGRSPRRRAAVVPAPKHALIQSL